MTSKKLSHNVEKKRLDHALVDLFPELTRSKAQSLIVQGLVKIDEQVCNKAGALVTAEQKISLEALPRYVSKAGFKLEKAFKEFTLTVDGLVALDAGISTGGFTDCLLQHGIARVYGIDVAQGEVAERVKNDPRVVLYENQNIRYLEKLPELVDLVTLDLSFISLKKVLILVSAFMKKQGILLVLIKPQFEAARSEITKQGIVTNPLVHNRVIQEIIILAEQLGFVYKGHVETDLMGEKIKNKEFLAYFTRS